MNRRCRRLGRERRGGAARRRDNSHTPANQLRRQRRQAIILALRPAIFDRNGAPLNPAEFVQSLHKGGGPGTPSRRRGYAQEPDGGQLARLLRPRHERPRGRTADQRDEFAPLHSITSSALTSNVAGTVRPSALAVLVFTAIMYFVGI